VDRAVKEFCFSPWATGSVQLRAGMCACIFIITNYATHCHLPHFEVLHETACQQFRIM